MNNLYNQSDVKSITERLESLTINSKRQWGTMTISQMLAHCNVSLETAMGLNFPKRKFIGIILGRLLKLKFLNKKPMIKNSITEDMYVINSDEFEFEKEKARAIELVHIFYKNGPEKATTHPHSYFGKLTPQEWAILKWKHYDHHLRQFGA